MEGKAGPSGRAPQSSTLHGWSRAQLCCHLDQCCTQYCFSVPSLLWSFFGPQTSLSYVHHILFPQGLLKSFVFYFRTLVLHFSILYSFITSCCKVLASPNCVMALIHLYSFSGNIPACCSPPFLGLRLRLFCNFSRALHSGHKYRIIVFPSPHLSLDSILVPSWWIHLLFFWLTFSIIGTVIWAFKCGGLA